MGGCFSRPVNLAGGRYLSAGALPLSMRGGVEASSSEVEQNGFESSDPAVNLTFGAGSVGFVTGGVACPLPTLAVRCFGPDPANSCTTRRSAGENAELATEACVATEVEMGMVGVGFGATGRPCSTVPSIARECESSRSDASSRLEGTMDWLCVDF